MVNDSVDKNPIYENTKATESTDSVDYQLQELINGTEELISYPNRETEPNETNEIGINTKAQDKFHDANEIKTNVIQTVKDGLGNEYILQNGILVPIPTLPQPKKPHKSLPKFNRIPPKITRDSSKLDLFQQQQKLLNSLSGFGTTSNSRFGELDTFQTKLKSSSTSKTSSRSTNSKSSRGSNLKMSSEIPPELIEQHVQLDDLLQQEPNLEQP